MVRPPPGSMVFWRFTEEVPCVYHFGYVTYVSGYDLIRMGQYNGDTMGVLLLRRLKLSGLIITN